MNAKILQNVGNGETTTDSTLEKQKKRKNIAESKTMLFFWKFTAYHISTVVHKSLLEKIGSSCGIIKQRGLYCIVGPKFYIGAPRKE